MIIALSILGVLVLLYLLLRFLPNAMVCGFIGHKFLHDGSPTRNCESCGTAKK